MSQPAYFKPPAVTRSKAGFFLKGASIKATPSMVKMDMMNRGGPVYQNAGMDLTVEASFYLTDQDAGHQLIQFLAMPELELNALVARWHAERKLVSAISEAV